MPDTESWFAFCRQVVSHVLPAGARAYPVGPPWWCQRVDIGSRVSRSPGGQAVAVEVEHDHGNETFARLVAQPKIIYSNRVSFLSPGQRKRRTRIRSLSLIHI